MVTDYCYSMEIKRALERHKRKEARVIPIILRPSSWEGTLGKLHALPTDAKPIANPGWHSPDDAFFDVEKGTSKVIEEISQQAGPQISSPTKTPPDNITTPTTNEQDKNAAIQTLKDRFHQAMIGIYKDADQWRFLFSHPLASSHKNVFSCENA